MPSADLPALLWIIGRHNPHALIEIRYRDEAAMKQRFIPANHVSRAARFIERNADKGDVYVGAAPRNKPSGGKDAINHVNALWVDCDTAESISLAAEFEPAPAYIVATGSGSNVQAWWPLRHGVIPTMAESLNRKLAHALKADMKATDSARILRPPGTLNHKHDPPTAVHCIAQVPGFVDPKVIHDLPSPVVTGGSAGPRNAGVRTATSGDLNTIAPADYIERLTGLTPGTDGMVRCPFHSGGKERTPSLKVYATPAKGWWCFGCARGGSVFDFAGQLWDLPTRGDGFSEINRRLTEALA